jgi:2-dehydropantoate 2-reductase
MQIVVYGAGAVGSVLGGLLSVQKHDVVLVCRKGHADAINEGGLHVRSATGDYVSRPRATEELSGDDVAAGVCVLVTVKSHDTRGVANTLAGLLPRETPVVSFQNGMDNEASLGAHFDNVYGGVCRITCQMLQPGTASFRRKGRLVVGKYPKGSDSFARSLTRAFGAAGFDACLSRNVIDDKWLKLVVNAQSAFHAVIDPRDHDANEFFELKARIIEEARAVLKAARIRARSCDRNVSSIDEMIADLRRPRMPRAERGMMVHNSTWQDLYLRRDTIETPFFHEPFIKMGREHGIAVPCHEVALDTALRCHREGLGPGTVRLQEVIDAIAKRGGR